MVYCNHCQKWQIISFYHGISSRARRYILFCVKIFLCVHLIPNYSEFALQCRTNPLEMWPLSQIQWVSRSAQARKFNGRTSHICRWSDLCQLLVVPKIEGWSLVTLVPAFSRMMFAEKLQLGNVTFHIQKSPEIMKLLM